MLGQGGLGDVSHQAELQNTKKLASDCFLSVRFLGDELERIILSRKFLLTDKRERVLRATAPRPLRCNQNVCLCIVPIPDVVDERNF